MSGRETETCRLHIAPAGIVANNEDEQGENLLGRNEQKFSPPPPPPCHPTSRKCWCKMCADYQHRSRAHCKQRSVLSLQFFASSLARMCAMESSRVSHAAVALLLEFFFPGAREKVSI
jgi:hypothetical protein